MHTYITEQQRNFFYEEGYLLIKGLFNNEVISNIRSIIEAGLKNGKWKQAHYHTKNITTDIYNLFPELVDLIFTEKYIQIMKDLLGDSCAIILEPAVHRNSYGYWHKDSSYLSLQNETFHLNDDFACAQTAIYLQDNHSEYGGGLTVIPKTQNSPNKFTYLYEMNLLDRIVLKIKKTLKISIFDKLENSKDLINLPSEAGDLIIFNYGLDHKGTPALKKDVKKDKLVLYNAFVNKLNYAKKQRDCLKKIKSDYSQIYLAQNNKLTPQLETKSEELNIEMLL